MFLFRSLVFKVHWESLTLQTGKMRSCYFCFLPISSLTFFLCGKMLYTSPQKSSSNLTCQQHLIWLITCPFFLVTLSSLGFEAVVSRSQLISVCESWMCANNLFSNIPWRLEMDHGNWRTIQISASTSHLSTYSFICGSSVIYPPTYLQSWHPPGAPLSPASPHLHWLLSAQSWLFFGMLNFRVPQDTVLRPCLPHLLLPLEISFGLMSLNTIYTLMTS